MQYVLSLKNIQQIAIEFIQKYKQHKVFVFYAEMGTGKTTFIIELLKTMGIDHPEGSPTYSLVNSYESSQYGKIYHFDLYRLNSIEEIYDIGIEEMLFDEDAFCFIEWPEKIEHLLPDTTIKVKIIKDDLGNRTILIENE